MHRDIKIGLNVARDSLTVRNISDVGDSSEVRNISDVGDSSEVRDSTDVRIIPAVRDSHAAKDGSHAPFSRCSFVGLASPSPPLQQCCTTVKKIRNKEM